MAGCPRIGVACPNPGERAALLEWLSSAGFEPLPMIEPESIGRALGTGGFEALIMDAELLAHTSAAPYLRLLGSNRPLVVIGDGAAVGQAEARRRDAAYLMRPVTRELVLLTVSLALAEGRPARRSMRQAVARIPATVDAVPATLIDVSYEGIRFELGEEHRAALPPFFKVQVPLFRVGVVAQRVWVGKPLAAIRRESSIWCGAALRLNTEETTSAWRTLVNDALSGTSHLGEVTTRL